jgi:hypothetical protein
MSGGKGGSQQSKVEIPAWIEGPATRNLQRAEQLAQMGYQPYYGPEVAAFNPMQVASMQAAADAASAFGLAAPMNVASTIPQAQDFGNGMMGYGSGQGFNQAVSQFQQYQPQQAAIYNSLFTGPNANAGYQAGPAMGGTVGGGEFGMGGGPMVTGDMIANNMVGGGIAGGMGGINPYGSSMPPNMGYNPTSGVGPYVASGMGAINPMTGMPSGGGVGGIGGGKGGASPYNPFTDGRGGVTGTPVSFPEGEAVAGNGN